MPGGKNLKSWQNNMIMRIIPALVSFLLMALHFIRGGNWYVAAVFLLLPGLLVFKKRFILLFLKNMLYSISLIWLYTAYRLIETRIIFAEPWMRLALIMLVLILFTFFAARQFITPDVKRFYRN